MTVNNSLSAHRMFTWAFAIVLAIAALFITLSAPATSVGAMEPSVAKAADKTVAEVGEFIIYYIDYTCPALLTDPCTDVNLTDPLPAGTQYVTATGTGDMALVGHDGGTPGTVTFNAASLSPGDAGQVAITVQVTSDAVPASTLTNTATIEWVGHDPEDSNPVDVLVGGDAPTPTPTPAPIPWTISKSAQDSTAPNNERDFSYTINVTAGTGTVDSATITDTLPPGAVFVSCTESCDSSGAPNIVWTFDPLTESKSLTIVVSYDHATAGNEAGESKTNTVALEGDWSDDAEGVGPIGDDTADITIREPYDDFDATKYAKSVRDQDWNYDDDDEVLIDEEVFWQIHVWNSSDREVTDLALEDNFPPEFNFTQFHTGSYYHAPVGEAYEVELNDSTWVSVTHDNDHTTNQTFTVADLVTAGVMTGTDVVTGVRISFDSVPWPFDDNDHPRFYGTYSGDDVAVGDTLENCMAITGDVIEIDDTTTTLDLSSCATHEIKDSWAKLNPSKTTVSGNIFKGGLSTFSIKVENFTTAELDLVNPIVADMLPEGFTFEAGSFTFTDNATGAPAPIETVIEDALGTQDLVRWSWTGASAATLQPGETIVFEFQARADYDMDPGTFTNETYQIPEDPSSQYVCYTTGVAEADLGVDLNGDGDTDDVLCNENSTQQVNDFPSGATAQLSSEKWVLGDNGVRDLDAADPADTTACEIDGDGYTRTPCVAVSTEGGLANYKLILTNDGSVDLTNIVLVDVLPHLNDTGVLLYDDARLTEWVPVMAGSVTSSEPSVVIDYSPSYNPCRPEIGGPNDQGVNCEDPTWSTTAPADITTVGAMRFDYGDFVLAPGASIELTWPMRVPVGTPADEIAWNSFAQKSTRDDIGIDLLASEPPKVGIITEPSDPHSYGNYVWHDVNENGIQDEPATDGINGVLVELYLDNGDGIQDPNTDTLVSFTYTGDDYNGDPGYYIFTDLEEGDYFAVFTPPTGYILTEQDASGDNGADDETDAEDDSDANIGNGITPITYIGGTEPEADMSWDAGVYVGDPIFDLALLKETVSDGPFYATGDVTFAITVINQGMVDALPLTVTDYIPAGLTYASSNAAAVTTTAYNNAIVITDNTDGTWDLDLLKAGDRVTFEVTMTVDADHDLSDITNWAEISAADDDNDAGTAAPTDVDSTPDGENGNTAGEGEGVVVDDDVSQDGNNGGDEDDHDPEQISFPDPFFDLALNKVLVSPGPHAAGGPATFAITVINQGIMPATDITVTDYVPAELAYASSNAATVTTTADTNAVVVTDNANGTWDIDALAIGDSVTFEVTMTIAAGHDGSEITNWAEISSADNDGDAGTPAPTDIDSTPDSEHQNTAGETNGTYVDNATDQDGTAGGDEDDHDPAVLSFIEPSAGFDLALKKLTASSGPYFPGADVTFTITVYNQGSVDATDVVVTDYIPAGLTYVGANVATVTITANNAQPVVVTDNTDGTYHIDALAAGDAVTFAMDFTIDGGFEGDLINWAEISSADDDGDAGTPAPTDIDSTPDATNQNQDGELDGTYVDNEVGADGTAGGDEDDHDPELINVGPPYFDLALLKVVSSSGPYVAGGDVTFAITVFNQGTMDATDITVTDYIPAELAYASSTAAAITTTTDGDPVVITDNANGTWDIDALGLYDSVTFEVTMTIDAAHTGADITNWAEISSADNDGDPGTDAPVDVDSTPDATHQNTTGEDDGVYIDNVVDQDGTAGGDEDDHDPATISFMEPSVGFDLALKKLLASEGPFTAGGTAIFTIEVYNQGTVDATDVVVTDYVPTGLAYTSSNAAAVTATSNNAPVVITDNTDGTWHIDALAAGDSVTIAVTMTIDAAHTGADLVNWAEISSADDDGDAGTPAPTDVDSTPDATNQNQTGEADGTYIDNETGQDGSAGGDEDDHDPAVLSFQPVSEGFDLALKKLVADAGPFTAGGNATFTITVFNQGTVDATDVVVTDYIPTGLAYAGSNAAAVTVTATAGAPIVITDNADGSWHIDALAAGDTVTFAVTMTIDAAHDGSEITNWAEISSADDDGDAGTPAPTDVDSTPDAEHQNTSGETDATYVDNATDQDGKTAGDEDDHDPATISFTELSTGFDLALKKLIASPAPYFPGADVTFTITVYNQGTVDATDIAVTDYVPTGLSYVSSNAADIALTGSNAPVVITDNADGTWDIDALASGDHVTFAVTMSIDAAFEGELVNWAEISSADDDGDAGTAAPTDVDSTPDAENQNTDGELDGTYVDNDVTQDGTAGGDEDDHDPERISVAPPSFDLALMKLVASPGPYTAGGTVTFSIEVFNQGTTDAYNVEITDYVPTGLAYDSSNAATVTATDAGAPIVITDNADGTWTLDTLGWGDRVTFEVTMTIDAAHAGTDITNWAEISAADDDTDPDNTPPTDADSTPDATHQNTAGEGDDTYIDNVVSEDGTDGGDEDDHDPATISFVPASDGFDLALKKLTATPGPWALGSDVVFTITVTNQGNVDAYNVVVTDYIPTGLTYVGSNAAAVSVTANNNAIAIADNADGTWDLDALAAGDSVTIAATMTIDADHDSSPITNWAEISEADNDTDPDNDPPTDIDSTPDADNQNTSGEETGTVVDNEVGQDGTDGGDEDDHDPETLTFPIFDLALMKVLVDEGPYAQGDSVTFTITVYNQGNVDAYDIDVTDYIPTGLTLESYSSLDLDITVDLATGVANIDSLPAGTEKAYDLTFSIDEDFQGTSLTNWAEISAADDDMDPDNTAPTDADSTPDADNQNTAGEADGTFVDNEVLEDGSADGDEDDHDPASVVVGQVFDLGLKKETVSTGTFAPGDRVTFSLTIENQGSLDAYNIDVVDYIPAELTYASSNAASVTATTNSNAVVVTDGGVNTDGHLALTIDALAKADSVVIEVTFTIDAAFEGESIINWAEIAAADDDTDPDNTPPTDVDSTPDSENGNTDGEQADIVVDNATNQDGKDGGDEDDHDPETITMTPPVFDLALMKTLKADQTIVPGGNVVFEITVTNQGEADAFSIAVTEHPPAGLTFVSLNAADVTSTDDGNAVVITDAGSGAFSIDTLAADDQVVVEITMSIDATATGDLTNYAEISAADDDTDPDNTAPTDVDSTPDTTNQNGTGETDDMVDNEVSEDGNNGGDEDDHDPETVTIPELAEIGNYVWYDNNYDGVQDSDEPGVEDVTVNLYDADDNLVATTTTDADGYYIFEDLVPGVYYIAFDLDTLPANYSPTIQNSGTNDAADSDGDPSTGRTIRTTLDADESDMTWDFGIYQPAGLGDYVWFDTDADGVQDAEEDGIENVTVNLLDSNGNVIATTTTNADGYYEFRDLPPGSYIVEFELPAGHGFTMYHEGLAAGADSDADRTTGRSELVTLTAGQFNPDIDAGMASGDVLSSIESEIVARQLALTPTPVPTVAQPTLTPTPVPATPQPTTAAATPQPTAVPPTPVPTAVPVQSVQGVNVGLTGPTINKAVSQSIGGTGDTLVYTINITNPNNTTMVDVRATDVLSSKLDYVSASSSQGTVSYSAGTRTLTASLGDITAGGTVTITIRARINGFAQSPDRIDNTAQALAANLSGVNSNVVSTQIIPNQIPTTGENGTTSQPLLWLALGLAIGYGIYRKLVLQRQTAG